MPILAFLTPIRLSMMDAERLVRVMRVTEVEAERPPGIRPWCSQTEVRIFMAITEDNKLRSLAGIVGIGSLALLGVTACDNDGGGTEDTGTEDTGTVDDGGEGTVDDGIVDDGTTDDGSVDDGGMEDPADPGTTEDTADPAQPGVGEDEDDDL